MHIESMKAMMECLCTKAKSQIDGNIENVDAKEFGEVIDMIKDLAEAKYYCKITDEMEEAKKEEEALAKAGIDPEMRYYTGGRRYYFDPSIHGGIDRDYGVRYYRPRRIYSDGGIRMYDDGYRGYSGGSGSGSSGGSSGSGSSGSGSMGGGGRYYNDNRYDNGRYAPDGNTMRNYTINYPDMYDPANSFNQNKWRLDKGKAYQPYESKFDKSLRYYQDSKAEHDKGTEEDNKARLKFLEGLLDSVGEVMMDSYDDASAPEQDMIEKKMSTWLSQLKS